MDSYNFYILILMSFQTFSSINYDDINAYFLLIDSCSTANHKSLSTFASRF